MKRSKRSRVRGRKTCGGGNRKKRRGKGSKGGKGMAGTGKRAGHHVTFVNRYLPNYLGRKKGFTSLKKIKGKEITLFKISEQLDKFLKTGIAKKTDKGIEINLENYKILSQGKLKQPLIIKAISFSKAAVQKIKEAGGEALTA
jgi:large subunit ribosomal protein L15